jgi:hypothetical protein
VILSNFNSGGISKILEDNDFNKELPNTTPSENFWHWTDLSKSAEGIDKEINACKIYKVISGRSNDGI